MLAQFAGRQPGRGDATAGGRQGFGLPASPRGRFARTLTGLTSPPSGDLGMGARTEVTPARRPGARVSGYWGTEPRHFYSVRRFPHGSPEYRLPPLGGEGLDCGVAAGTWRWMPRYQSAAFASDRLCGWWRNCALKRPVQRGDYSGLELKALLRLSLQPTLMSAVEKTLRRSLSLRPLVLPPACK